MVKYTDDDVLLGIRKAKSFSKEVREQVRKHVKMYLEGFGRKGWCSLEEIRKDMLNSELFNFKSPIVWRWMAIHYGFRGEIVKATSYWRRKKLPIIAGAGRQGYCWADENCDRRVELWTSRQLAWALREGNWIIERKIDVAILDEIIKKEKDSRIKKELIKVRVKYFERRNREIEEDNEES